jgi:hypothetical protein
MPKLYDLYLKIIVKSIIYWVKSISFWRFTINMITFKIHNPFIMNSLANYVVYIGIFTLSKSPTKTICAKSKIAEQMGKL